MVDKDQIVGSHKKHLNLHQQHGHIKLGLPERRTDESLNRSRLKKQMFTTAEESPKKGPGEAPEVHFQVNVKGVDGDLKEQLLYK